ncbi:MAG TPA: hypothetical protein VI685_29540 [Candidatus Angelobacter sp.]
MLRKVLWILLLSFSLAALSQVSAPASQYNPSVPAVTPPPAGYGGTVWTGPGPLGGVLLTTPTASFPSPPTAVGISDAGRAGISNTSGPYSSGVPIVAAPATYFYMPYASPAESIAPSAEGTSEEARNDLLPSYSVNNVGTPANMNGPSLAEIAARYQRERATQTARTYTNADVPRENAGLLTRIWVAEGKLPAAGQNPTLMASATPPQPPNAGAVAQAQGSASGTASEQGQTQSQRSQLPASSTILPLLGLLGLVSGGLGVLLKRRR